MPLAVQLKHFENEKAWNDDSDEGTSQAKKESKPDPLGLTIRPRQAADDSAVAPAAATAPNEDEILGRLQAYMNKYGDEEDVAAATPAKANEQEVLDRILVYMNKDPNSPWTDKKKSTAHSEETTTCDEGDDEACMVGARLLQDTVEPQQEEAADQDTDSEPSDPRYKQVVLDIAYYHKNHEHHKKNIKIREKDEMEAKHFDNKDIRAARRAILGNCKFNTILARQRQQRAQQNEATKRKIEETRAENERDHQIKQKRIALEKHVGPVEMARLDEEKARSLKHTGLVAEPLTVSSSDSSDGEAGAGDDDGSAACPTAAEKPPAPSEDCYRNWLCNQQGAGAMLMLSDYDEALGDK